MAARVIFGPLKFPHADESLPADINTREISILVPIALAVVLLGVFPNVVLKSIEQSVRALTPMDNAQVTQLPMKHLQQTTN